MIFAAVLLGGRAGCGRVEKSLAGVYTAASERQVYCELVVGTARPFASRPRFRV